MARLGRKLFAGMMSVGLSVAAAVSGLALSAGKDGAHAQGVTPTFSAVFSPDTIGPGGTTTLSFTITNTNGTPVTALDFTNNLPAGVTLADPAGAATTCTGGTLTAPNGGSTISYTGGAVGASQSCTVSARVTAAVAASYVNTSGNLTSSAGNSGSATDTLNVVDTRPGFSKAFGTSTTTLGSIVPLTFTIDNSANASNALLLAFTDNLPSGMTVAGPGGASPNTCGGIATATAGSSSISLSNGTVNAGNICTLTVNVVAGAVGELNNVSGELTSSNGGPTVSSGVAVDTLTVTGPASGGVSIVQQFQSATVAPGATIDVQYTLQNTDNSFAATNVSFTADLDAALSGMVATGLPASNVCGAGSTLSGTSTLSLSGGSLASRANCVFTVTFQVPGGASDGPVTVTTSQTSATINGSTVNGSPASSGFTVDSAIPTFTKFFTDDPVAGGDTVTVEYTITNSSSTQSLTGLSFNDPVGLELGVQSGATLPANGSCGAGSFFFAQVANGYYRVEMSGGNLAPSASCTFQIQLPIPAGQTAGNYVSTTSALSGTSGGNAVTAPGARDTLAVTAPDLDIALTKTFTNDPVVPGSTATLEFTLANNTEGATLMSASFSDDLDAMLSGAVASGLPANGFCGAGSTASGSGQVTFSNLTLDPNDSCTFTIGVDVPSGAGAGSYPNTTSDVSGDVGGGVMTQSGSAATDTLVVAAVTGVTATKSFTDDPVAPGGTVTLEFTLTNPNAGDAASGIFFTDNLAATLSGLSSTSGTVDDICGPGSQISGTTSLIFVGGSLAANDSCTFSITASVPSGATPGDYRNTTSNIQSNVGASSGLTTDPAVDILTVRSPIGGLVATKSFTDDPVQAGDTVTLEFTLDNTGGVDAIDSIDFTDDLDAMLSGATATGLPMGNVCGTGSTVSGVSTITVSGANLAAGASCTFSVTVQVPGGAAPNTYNNTTSPVSATSGTFSGTVPAATDTLQVAPSTVTLTKIFTNDPVAPGETVTLEFLIQNPTGGSTLNDIRFSDDLDATLTGLVATNVPQSNVCGSGSTLSGTSLLALTGGTLGPGASCTFSVTLQVPANAAPGSYVNTTSNVTEVAAIISPPATDTLVISNPAENLQFTKSFTNDPVAPGNLATLQFNITNPDTTSTVTAINFTDDLDAMLSGSTGTNPPSNGFCGAGSTMSVGSTVTVSGASLAPGASCSFTVSVQTPNNAAPGSYTNTTSAISGTVNTVAATAGTASDDLVIVAAPVLTVTPATGLTSTGPQGGPFSPASQVYTLQNTGTIALSYTATGDQAFFDVTPTSGTLAAGASTTVTVAYTAAANALAPGNYTGTATFTNLTDVLGTPQTRAVNLTVEALGSVTIVQQVQGPDGTFTFTSTTAALNRTLTTVNGTASTGAISLAGGTYQVQQSGPDGYGLAAASCNDTDSTVDLNTRTATIMVAPNEAIVCTFESVNSRQKTVEVINRFLHRRADLILSSEPDSGRRIDRLRGNGSSATQPFNFGLTAPGAVSAYFDTSVAQIRASYAAEDRRKAALAATNGVFARSPGYEEPQSAWDFWVSAQVTKFDSDGGADGDGMFAIVHAGADYKLSTEVLIGALVQIDYLDQKWQTLTASASGTGWMAGPYATVKITDNLFFDTRAAWGTSQNSVSPFNTYKDTFTTTRWLARAGLIGDWRAGNWMFRPSANVAYIEEKQDAYTDSLNVLIPGQTVGVGRFDFGPSVSYRYVLEDGTVIEPSATLTGIWNFITDTSGATATTAGAATEFRARAEVGVRVRGTNGVSVEAQGAYDGIGADNYDAISGRAVLRVPFN